MKTKAMTILLAALFLTAPALADDFWAIYGENLAYKHAVAGGYIPSQPNPGNVTEGETRDIALKTFSVAFGARLTQIAKNRKEDIINKCVAENEPYKCFVDTVVGETISETRFLPEVRFSENLIRKLKRFHDKTLGVNEPLNDRMKRAARVPPWKKFNPRINFRLDDPELVVATPFYTFLSIYVEPRWGTDSGPILLLMKKGVLVEIDQDRATLQFRLLKNPMKRGYYSFHMNTDGSIVFDSFLMMY